ncbi:MULTISPECIES: hypothetical protein [Burkholderia]|uniref:Uncharacterized protein n=1 Tax=Burkholderia anthinoferrum TaxID=3090833 RepID=A0ABU5WKR9_9BURK|nr:MULTISPECIES: hypothetical protein [Burkholderia]MEB2503870.1 hypothetical protein [Burkholderia anthinoferrum]MEB2579562.1 hypothetical protein [Burkholderia anthinoferrum]
MPADLLSQPRPSSVSTRNIGQRCVDFNVDASEYRFEHRATRGTSQEVYADDISEGDVTLRFNQLKGIASIRDSPYHA